MAISSTQKELAFEQLNKRLWTGPKHGLKSFRQVIERQVRRVWDAQSEQLHIVTQTCSAKDPVG